VGEEQIALSLHIQTQGLFFSSTLTHLWRLPLHGETVFLKVTEKFGQSSFLSVEKKKNSSILIERNSCRKNDQKNQRNKKRTKVSCVFNLLGLLDMLN